MRYRYVIDLAPALLAYEAEAVDAPAAAGSIAEAVLAAVPPAADGIEPILRELREVCDPAGLSRAVERLIAWGDVVTRRDWPRERQAWIRQT